MKKLSDAEDAALCWLAVRGGNGGIDRYGRIVALGEVCPRRPETWLRLMLRQHVAAYGQDTMRLGLTPRGHAYVRGRTADLND